MKGRSELELKARSERPTSCQWQVVAAQEPNPFSIDSEKYGEKNIIYPIDVTDRHVVDFFIPTTDPSGQTKNVDTLKQIGNVENFAHYTVESVKTLRDPKYFTGIKITPKE